MAIDLTRFIQRFVEEARDHLRQLAEGLAALDRDPSDREVLNAVFRSAHTIKGSSRMLRLTPITETAHRLEDVLGPVRDGTIAWTPHLGRLVLRGVDALAGQVDRLAETGDAASLSGLDPALGAALLTASQAEGAKAPPEPTPPPAPPAAPAAAAAPVQTQPRTADSVRVRLTKLDELIKLQGEVVSSHARLRQRLTDIQAVIRALPDPPAQGSGAVAEAWAAHRTELRHFAQALRDDVLAQELLMSQLHDKALVMRMLPLAVVFEGCGRLVRDLAESVGKEAECDVSGAEIELDRQVIERLSDPIVHLLRNAVDHGLETPATRQSAGKPERGRISLSARQDGGWVVIEVTDDGGGIPCQAIREKAVRKGLLSADKAAALGDQETVDLIFLPGFSTSAIITDLSGRGVGMDVVKQCVVDDLQGTVSVETRPGAGTTFVLRLPLSLAVMRILVVGVEGAPFAFASQHVAELVRVPASALVTIGERAMVVIRNEFVPVVTLADLLAIRGRRQRAAAGESESDSLLLVIIQVRNQKLALRVDQLLDERDMVMKPLPDHMRRFHLVSGMVITGRNEMVSVLHGPALLDLARRARGAPAPGQAQAQATGAASDRNRHILVVDDSLNTREIEKDVLEAWGYRVTLAEDGRDGLAKALAEPFDAVLTDVEMPHMDGFTLTARLREDSTYRTRPIIIVTSREKEEDKRRGIEVGADAYIVKGEFDQTGLVDTLRSLLG